MKRRYTKPERLQFIMEMITSLRGFKGESGMTIDLYNDQYSAIKLLKNEFNSYLHQDDEASVTFEGTTKFEELNRKMQYRLPAFFPHKPMLLIKKQN